MTSSLFQAKLPIISVIIPTRNRGERVLATVQSVLANDYANFDIWVIDQSEDTKTEQALLCLVKSNPRLNYLRTPTIGSSIARNIGIEVSCGDLIAMTDDDCTVPAGWLQQVVTAFTKDQKTGLVFGNVFPVSYDRKTGYIPVFERVEPNILTSLKDKLFAGMGIGACCAIKREAWLAVEGFDQMMGPGTRFRSMEDRDLALRVLVKGYYVYSTCELEVLHFGFRANKELKKLAFRDWFGFGSTFAKFLKCGDFAITPYMVGDMWFGQAIKPFLKGLVFKRKIQGVTPIWSFWAGFLTGLFTGVDRPTRKFKVSEKQHLVSKIDC